jgi:hypothetical protein
MVGLREQTDKHKDQIKQLQRELEEKTAELENVRETVCSSTGDDVRMCAIGPSD